LTSVGSILPISTSLQHFTTTQNGNSYISQIKNTIQHRFICSHQCPETYAFKKCLCSNYCYTPASFTSVKLREVQKLIFKVKILV